MVVHVLYDSRPVGIGFVKVYRNYDDAYAEWRELLKQYGNASGWVIRTTDVIETKVLS